MADLQTNLDIQRGLKQALQRQVILAGTGNGTTNNDAAIASAIAAITVMTRSESSRVTFVVPSGSYNFVTPFRLPSFTDLHMENGAELYYTGTNRSVAAVTAGGADDNQESYGRFTGICIRSSTSHQWWPSAYGGTTDPDYYAGFRLTNMYHGIVEIRKISNFMIGFQAYPSAMVASHAVCYCTIYVGELASNKISIDLRGSLNNGFVNENLFVGGNYFAGSALYNYGSCHAIRMSADVSGYTGNNNNVFLKPCIQNGTATLSNGLWVGGATAVAGQHVNFEGRDYLVTTGGVMHATVGPSHTTGSAANGAATLQYMELYRRSVILYDNAGLYNRIQDARREGGLGAPIQMRGSVYGNDTEVTLLYQANILTASSLSNGGQYDVEVQSPTVTLNRGVLARARAAANYSVDTRTTILTDIHKKLIKGTTMWGGPGIFFNADSATAAGSVLPVQFASTSLRFCVDGIVNDGVSKSPVVVIPLSSDWAKVMVSPIRDDANSDLPRYRVWALDAEKKVLANTTADTLHLLVNAGARHATLQSQAGEADVALTHMIMKNSTAVHYIALQYDLGCFKGFNITQLNTLLDSSYATAPPSIVGSNMANRYSIGAPTVGFFEVLGEFIANAAFAGAGSPGWYVSTSGVLCPDWSTANVVLKGQFVKNASKVYYAQASGTTGATAPTHSSGAVSDGTVTWVYYGAEAALTAAPTV